jgi:hypothetical protein
MSNYYLEGRNCSCGGQLATNGKTIWCTECGNAYDQSTIQTIEDKENKDERRDEH